MSMTRKDYVVAGAINRTRQRIIDNALQTDDISGDLAVAAVVADDIADTLADDNPRFDRERFLAACRIGEVNA